jgi:uncharacterized membrane protein/general stress protein YciG
MPGYSKRGFASMNPEKQREIASKGGREAHRQGTAHEFSSEEARAAGRLGGKMMGANRAHMALIGRKGGQRSTTSRRSLSLRKKSGDKRNDQDLPLTSNTTNVVNDLSRKEFAMSSIEKSIDVHVPLHTAYNQWTQFEEFPCFMEGVEEVKQLDDKRLYWRANVGGKEKQWEAIISEQSPDRRIAWHNTTGPANAGVVTFHRINDKTTRVMLQLEYVPEGVLENVGDMIGVVSNRVQGDLRRFKEFIEERGTETGAWRGEIQQSKI